MLEPSLDRSSNWNAFNPLFTATSPVPWLSFITNSRWVGEREPGDEATGTGLPNNGYG